MPEIIRLLETTDPELKAKVNNYLREEYENLKEETGSFQELNLSKERAKKELEKLNLEYITIKENNRTNYRRSSNQM